jgi:AcrR family transcriptional regulator
MMPGKPAISVWARPERASRGPQPGMSRPEIVEAAIRIADADGLDAVSMRRVATELGSGTMSLYRYVDSRDELIELMYDQVQGEHDLPAKPTGDWRADLRLLAMQNRAVALRHPWMPGLFVARPSIGPKSLWLMEFGLSAMDNLGLDVDTGMGFGGTVSAFVRGFVQAELADTEALRRTGLTEDEWRAATGPYMQQMLASGRYPAIAKAMRDGDDHPDPEEAFASALDLVLDGIEVRLARYSK